MGSNQLGRLQVDAAVDIREEDGRISIEPIQPAQYDLDALIRLRGSPERSRNAVAVPKYPDAINT